MKKSYAISVIPGDGTGPEVVREACKALAAVAGAHGFTMAFNHVPLGGETYLRTGELLPDAALAALKQSDAILLGAIGHPGVKPGILERGILLRLRFELDQYVNLRPVKLYPGVACPVKNMGPADIDYTVIRENSGGLYTGIGGVSRPGTRDEVAQQVMLYTHAQVERCLRYAFGRARSHGKKTRGAGAKNTLALVGKSNVLTHMHGLWDRVFAEVGAEYPDVAREYCHVDAACLYMVLSPAMFDVVVTENMFGDILTDLAAATQGGLGVAAGANINPDPGGVSMFEPIGGTAPLWTGRNAINPLAAIGAAAMLLEHLGETRAARAVTNAIAGVTPRMKSQSANEMGFTTTQIGDMVAEGIGQG